VATGSSARRAISLNESLGCAESKEPSSDSAREVTVAPGAGDGETNSRFLRGWALATTDPFSMRVRCTG
jgi:hypothetical protein